jgi:hypothetical protein
MIKYLIFILIFLGGCSFKTPQNEWQYKSASNFESYKKNFLQGDDALAKSDLKRAIKHAKQSADLTQLARIYLGVCSLNIANGINNECKEYKEISNLVHSKELESYYHLITKTITAKEIQFLPQEYQEFSLHLLKKSYTQANQDILTMKKTSSPFVAAALMKETLDNKTREYLLQKASFFGYKKTVLFWLQESLKYTKKREEIEQIQKKLSILNSKS